MVVIWLDHLWSSTLWSSTLWSSSKSQPSFTDKNGTGRVSRHFQQQQQQQHHHQQQQRQKQKQPLMSQKQQTSQNDVIRLYFFTPSSKKVGMFIHCRTSNFKFHFFFIKLVGCPIFWRHLQSILGKTKHKSDRLPSWEQHRWMYYNWVRALSPGLEEKQLTLCLTPMI